MATEIGRGVIPVTFDRNQIGRDLSQSVDHAGRQSEGSVGSTFRRLAGVASAAFAGVQVFSFFSGAVEGAREANRIAAQTEAVIASTGGAAGLTAQQFSSLAEAISMKTGIDDEQIQSAENLLATFTNLHDSVGAGNDIFSQATRIAVDMGAALGGDASSNALQLGKALNDPIRGISALTRVGVTFTDQQRAQITAMQQAGDMAGAQRVILAELNTEFGGSAEATATAGAKWSVFWGNIQEKVGGLLIPLLDRLATWAMTTLPNAFARTREVVGPIISTIVEQVTLFWNALTSGFTENEGTPIESIALRLRDIWGDVFPVLQRVGSFVKDNLKPILIGLGAAILTFVVPPIVGWAAAQVAALAPILAVVAAVTLLVGGVVYAYQHFEGFRNVVDSVARFFRDTVWPIIQRVAAAIAEQFSNLVAGVRERWDLIKEAIGNVLTAIKVAVGIALAPILLIWSQFHEQIMAVVGIVWDLIKGTIENAIRIITGIFDFFLSLLTGNWGDAWQALVGIFSAVWDQLKLVLSAAWDILGQAFSAALDGIKAIWDAAWGAMRAVLDSIWDGVVAGFQWVLNGIIGALESAINFAIDAINIGINGLNVLNPFGDVMDPLNPVHFGRLGESESSTGVSTARPISGPFHDGVWAVPGQPGEQVLSLLEAGETVVARDGTIGGQPFGAEAGFSIGKIEVNGGATGDETATSIVREMRREAMLAGVA